MSHSNWNNSDCRTYQYSWGTVETCWDDQAVFQYVLTPSGNTIYSYSADTTWTTTYNYNDGTQDSTSYYESNNQRFLIRDGEQHIFRIDDKLDQVVDRYGTCSFFVRERTYKKVNGQVMADSLLQDAGSCD